MYHPEFFLIPARIFAFCAIMCVVYLLACAANAIATRVISALRARREARERRNWHAVLKKIG